MRGLLLQIRSSRRLSDLGPALGRASTPDALTSVEKDTAMSSHHLPWLEIFTTPTCPDCRALKAWLETQGIPFVERDLRDPSVVEEARRRTGVRVAPITIAGDQVLYGTFAQQKPRLTEFLGLVEAA